MASMSDGIAMRADAGPGGLGKGLMRKALGGESLFMGRYEALVEGAWVAFAPKFPGDITEIALDGGIGIVAESGSLLALSGAVNADVRWAGVRNIVLREGATMLHLTGEGTALVCSYGGIVRHDLAPEQRMIVDTGHLVAYSDTVAVRVGPLSGLVAAQFSGEGLVAELTGPGTVFIQTRAESDLRSWVLPKRAQNS
jgi:uncharacterized protein (TIGR00266 family)